MGWVRLSLRAKKASLCAAILLIYVWHTLFISTNTFDKAGDMNTMELMGLPSLPAMDTLHKTSGVRETVPGTSDVRKVDSKTAAEDIFSSFYKDVIITGNFTQRRHLVVGIPTVYRQVGGTSYMEKTLKSLIRHIPNTEDVVILIFPCDFDTDKQNLVIQIIKQRYQHHLDSGFIQIMQMPSTAYPSLTNLKRNYKDAPQRVYWRSKQVVDFAFMFYYGKDLADYYLQIEDDVISAIDMYPRIQAAITKYTDKTWAVLEFSHLGFIGKLFRASDLERFAKFLFMFYYEMPVDWLFIHFYRLLTQPKAFVEKPTLFQHFGLHSSLQEKPLNKFMDKDFKNPDPLDLKEVQLAGAADAKVQYSVEDLKSNNPPAMVTSTLETYQIHAPSLAYASRSDLFFWGKSPTLNDTFAVDFVKPVRLKSVEISTGSQIQQNDYLRYGIVETCNVAADNSATACRQYDLLGEFDENGQFSMHNITLAGLSKVMRVRVTKKQEEWLIISSIVINSR